MCITKLLPRSIRMAMFYVKAKKIVANSISDNNTKLSTILSLEKRIIGDASIFKGTTFQDTAIAIGIKDMVSIFLQIKSPDNALRYLAATETNFSKMIEIKKNNEPLFEGYAFFLFYYGMAYGHKGLIDECYNKFDQLNRILNDRINENPSNSRLEKLYGHLNKRIFDVFMEYSHNYPEDKQKAYRTCLTLLKKFDERDPCNEQIKDYISRFK